MVPEKGRTVIQQLNKSYYIACMLVSQGLGKTKPSAYGVFRVVEDCVRYILTCYALLESKKY